MGVRPGLKSFPVTGLPVHTEQPGPVGFDVYNNNLVVVVDDEIFRIPIASPAAISMGTYAARATSFVRFTEGDNYLYSISAGLLYKHAADITTSIALPAGVTLSTITRWGYYLIGTDANIPWRLYFSKVSAAGPEFDVWEPNAYVDIGGNSEIVALKPMFNQLLVGKPEGWSSLSGVLATTPVVRHLVSGNGPLDQREVTTTTDNRVLYWGQETLPHWFNGSSVRFDSNFRIGRHDSDYPSGVIFGAVRNSTVGDAVQLVSVKHNLQRPANAADQWSSPTDFGDTASSLVSGAMATPAWYDPQGRQVMVRNVQIAFRKWPSGVSGSLNELQVRVRPLARWNAGSIETASQLWTEPSSRSDVDGTDDSVSFNFGAEGTALGFQIEIPVMKGIAIREINVACEVITRRM